jgi:transcriptional regulator with XRE-family HTH domain
MAVSSMDLFAKRLSQFVKELGWSQELLGAKAGISQGSANLYLRGKREPSLEIIDRIARAVGVPVRVFFEDVDMPIMRYVPTPEDAIRVIQRALSEAKAAAATPPVQTGEPVDLTHWPVPCLRLLSELKESDDIGTVMATAKAVVETKQKRHKKIREKSA